MLDFWDLGRLVGRRWRIAVPMFVLAIAMTALIFTRVKPDYIATAYVQLVPPTPAAAVANQPARIQRNPWLSQSLAALGNASLVTIQDVGYVQSLKDRGYSDSYTVAMNDSTPLITLQVTGKSEAQASGTADQLVEKFDQSLDSLQADYKVESIDLITARRLDGGTNVTESSSNVKRAVAAFGVVGLVLAAAVTIASDAWLRRRARAKANRAEATPVNASLWRAKGSPPSVQWLVDADDTNTLTMTRVFRTANRNGSGVANGNGNRIPQRLGADNRPTEHHPADPEQVDKGPSDRGRPGASPNGRDMADDEVPADATVVLPRATSVHED
jgi:capsular polysaccharide biosynthesis protein